MRTVQEVLNWGFDLATKRLKVFMVDANGDEKFTADNPAAMTLSGSATLKGATATVTTAGTRVQLPNYACREVTIIAKDTNTGSVFVGGNDVSAAVYGVKLSAKESITLTVSNTNLIYINASVSGEGISYVAL